MATEKDKDRKRMVVEEVSADESPKEDKMEKETISEPQILEEAAKDTAEIENDEEVKKDKEVKKETPIEESPELKKSPSIVLWIIIPGIFLLGAILGGIVFYQRGVSNGGGASATPTANPSITSQPTPSASPSGTLDLTKYTISVFNGSGIAGEAGKVKTLLTDAGFEVGSTGNAATYDYTKTIIKAKDTVDSDFLSELTKTLGETYEVDSVQSLEESSKDSVQVVVGTTKKE